MVRDDRMTVSDKTKGVWIRSFHLTIPFYSLMVLFFGGPIMVTCVVMTAVITGVLFMCNRDCFLSRYEQRLFKDNLYGIDIVLEIFDLDKTSYTRFVASALFAVGFYVIAFVLVYMRFLRFPTVDTLILLQ